MDASQSTHECEYEYEYEYIVVGPARRAVCARRGRPKTRWRGCCCSKQVTRGRRLGGSSSITGLNFLRGHRSSYDRWPQQGAAGWACEDLLPFFMRSENAPGRNPAVRGVGGPLTLHPRRSPTR